MNVRKHWIVFAVCLFLVPSSVMSQFRMSALKIGYLNPKDAQPGLFLSSDFTFPIDETTELGISTNLYYRNYKKLSTVAAPGYSAGINETTQQKELEYTTLSIPVYAIVNFVIPTSRYFGYQIHSANVTRNRTETPEGLPIWNEVNLSGFGFRFGLRFHEL